MAILQSVKEKMQRMLGTNTIEQTLHIMPAISTKMSEAIDEWTAMYEDNAEWLHEPNFGDPTLIVSLGLPAFIASEKARMATLELQSEITAPTEEQEVDNPNYVPPVMDEMGNLRTSNQPKTIVQEKVTSPKERAEFMNKEYQDKLLSKLRTQLEFGIAKGSLIIKPYVVKTKIADVAGVDTPTSKKEYKYSFEFDFVQADCFYPFAFDSSGNLTEVAFVQSKVDKENTYTRLEYHKLENGNVTIINRAFKSLNTTKDTAVNTLADANLGVEIQLTEVSEWKNIPPTATIKNVDRMLFGYFKMPEANTIDPHSPLGISGFARAKSLIKQADLQYSRLLWEYEGGQLAIDIDRDALADVTDFKGNTHTVMGNLQKRLYRPVDLGESDTYKPYAPSLRDASMINGLNSLLMRIEDVVALSRGTISEVAAEARTATEIKILKQRSYSSNAEIQAALELCLKDVVYAMDVHCSVYNMVGDVVKTKDGKVDVKKLGQYDVSFTWDDSIITDIDTEVNKRLLLQEKGLVSKLENRMWYFGETKRQAKEALERIQQENQEAIEQNMAMSSQMAQSMGKGDQNKDVGTPNSDKTEKSEQKKSQEQNQNDQFQNLQQEVLKKDKGQKMKVQDVENEEEKITK